MSWPSASLPLSLAALLAGCTSDGGLLSDYTLDLQPRAPANQAGMFDDASISLVFRTSTDVTVEWVDDLASEEVSRADFGPLEAARVGVLVERPGGQPSQIDDGMLLAYGEAGPFTLSTGEEEVQARFVLAAYGGVGDLDVLPDDEGALRAAAAMTPDGTTWIFGGSRRTYTSHTGHAFVQKLAPLDDGEWAFDVVAEMPDYEDGDELPDSVVGATATYVEASGRPYILVAGGRPKNTPYEDNSAHAALWDPIEEEWAWEDDSAMKKTRAQHRAIRMQNGNVLLVGGIAEDGAVGDATAEIFDVDKKRFDLAGTLVMPSIGFAAADLGPKGVLACGGGYIRGTTEQYTEPSDACYVVSLTGEVAETAPLPKPVQALAMAPLGDGRVLACGGIAENAPFSAPVEAIPDAWIYDPASGTWTELTSRLNTPRALHEAIPMPDGKVLIVGGAGSGALLDGTVEDPVTCNEVFEPDTFTFTTMEPCGAAGGGGEPMIAWHPDHGAVAAEGYGESASGGLAYGVIGFPPNL